MAYTIDRTSAAYYHLARYYTGKPCRRYHDAERYTANGACVECVRRNLDRTSYWPIRPSLSDHFSQPYEAAQRDDLKLLGRILESAAPEVIKLLSAWQARGLTQEQMEWMIANHPGGILKVDPSA